MDEARKRWVFSASCCRSSWRRSSRPWSRTAMPTVVASLGGIRIYSWVFSGFLLTSDGDDAALGTLLRSLRPTAGLPGRPRDLPRRLGAVGRVPEHGAADPVPDGAGLGAGALMTLGYTIIGELFGLERRARMQGYISSVWGLASLMGRWVGGLLTDHVVLALGLLHQPAVRRGGDGVDRLRVDRGAAPGARPVIGLGRAWRSSPPACPRSCSGSSRPAASGSWSQPEVVACSCWASVVLGGVRRGGAARRRADRAAAPVQEPDDRGRRRHPVPGRHGDVRRALLRAAVPAVGDRRQSATRRGLVLTPFVLGWVVMSVVSARLVLRVGYRSVVLTGMASLTVAFLLFRTLVGHARIGRRDDRRAAGRHRHGAWWSCRC